MEKQSENVSQIPASLPLHSESVWTKFSWVKNKYLLTSLGFLVWMLFFDRNDLPIQWNRVNELSTLQQNERAMNQLISDTKRELELLKTNPSTLEKYAREKFMMKRDNEDLYIITQGKQ